VANTIQSEKRSAKIFLIRPQLNSQLKNSGNNWNLTPINFFEMRAAVHYA